MAAAGTRAIRLRTLLPAPPALRLLRAQESSFKNGLEWMTAGSPHLPRTSAAAATSTPTQRPYGSTAPQQTEDKEDNASYYGIPSPEEVVAERPTWLPVNKYLHEGKEVVKISGSAVYGFRSTIHYADGSFQTQSNSHKSTYSNLDDLIKQFGFITYKMTDHTIYYAGELFEAVPVEDPSEWEEFEYWRDSRTSGWRRIGCRFRKGRDGGRKAEHCHRQLCECF